MIRKVEWPAPSHIHAYFTTRENGFDLSHRAPTEHFERLKRLLELPQDPYWLDQMHTDKVIELPSGEREADAVYTSKEGIVCAIRTGDCVPILLTDRQGERVAAIHAGWKGLAAGVIENTVTAMQKKDLFAWIGPCIGANHFEVDAPVYELLIGQQGEQDKKYHVDLFSLAKERLQKMGVREVFGEPICTYERSDLFFSHRRKELGRMATLIWKTER